MRFLLFLLVAVSYSCVDDRDFSTEELSVNPEYQLDFIKLQLSAKDFNSGNFSVPDQIKDTTEVDFLRENINIDYLETVAFQVYVENTIDQPIELNFNFFNPEDQVVYEYTKTIQSGSANTPSKKEFLVDLSNDEVISITDATTLQLILTQPQGNSQQGEFQLRSVVQFSYKYTP